MNVMNAFVNRICEFCSDWRNNNSCTFIGKRMPKFSLAESLTVKVATPLYIFRTATTQAITFAAYLATDQSEESCMIMYHKSLRNIVS